MVETLNLADGLPVSLSTNYFAPRRFVGAGDVFRKTKSLPATLQHFGIKNHSRAVSRITARLPSSEDARLLQQQPTRPVLQSEAIDVDEQGIPVVVTTTRFASDRVQIIFNTATVKPAA
jgi:GntR family phosphonate transport system transcriptional regulator